jgi:SAM-dependent methyltransferase
MLPILECHARSPLRGKVLFLGYPDIYFSYQSFLRMAQIANVPIAVRECAELDPKFGERGYCSARAVFSALGVDSIASLDVSGFERADFIFDLNNAKLSREIVEQFDLVIDHGTIEHVFHLPNCLKNIHGMLKTGGRVIHSAPGNNMFDHGFYQFSPTLFADFYSTNGWRIERQLVIQFTKEQETEPPFFAPYDPALFSQSSYGGLDSKLYANFVVATKIEGASADRIPQQGYYSGQSVWTQGQFK